MDRYNELVELINKANYEYHVLDNPTTLTDEEYDNYLREIYKLEEENPSIIRDDSPTHKIGGVVLDKFEKDVEMGKSHTYRIQEFSDMFMLGFNFTEEEVPHSITCVTDSVEIGKTNYNIKISIIVDRDSLKKIVIGKQGEMIKKIGIEARKDLEALLNKNVYLELFVKTVKKWRDQDKYLNEFGYEKD